jgi:hypothetical protein
MLEGYAVCRSKLCEALPIGSADHWISPGELTDLLPYHTVSTVIIPSVNVYSKLLIVSSSIVSKSIYYVM